MNILIKIHSLKQYIKYAFNAKTKYRIHSPFVFAFVRDVLEAKTLAHLEYADHLIKFYKNENLSLSTKGNAGEGSSSVGSDAIPAASFIQKVGLPVKYGKVLNGLIRENKIERVLELGTSLGLSASYLLAANEVQLSTIEANKTMLAHCQMAFTKLGIGHRVDFIHAKFDDVLEEHCASGLENTLVFIDGDHNKEAVLRYFSTCLKYSSTSTILVFDDINWSKGMTEAWHDICQHKDVKLSIDIFRLGLVFFREATKEKEHFKLWY